MAVCVLFVNQNHGVCENFQKREAIYNNSKYRHEVFVKMAFSHDKIRMGRFKDKKFPVFGIRDRF